MLATLVLIATTFASAAEPAPGRRTHPGKATLATLVLIATTSASAADPSPGLGTQLETIAAAHKGKAAVAMKHLGTGETYFRNADDAMPTASLIKLPIMAEVYFQA